MTPHQLFKELIKLNEEDREVLLESVREASNVRNMCEKLGISYNEEICISWINNTSNYRLRSTPVSAPPSVAPDSFTQKMEQIILGDNLDIIEEAAEKKGLI